jgi:hypothetical protein
VTVLSFPPVDAGDVLPADTTPLTRIAVFVAVVRHAAPHVIEASLVPTALFYCCLVLIGLTAAFAAALLWVYAAVVVRVLWHQPVPPLLVLGAIGITVRTAISMVSGSTFYYFAQPVIGSAIMGCVFLLSVAVGRPMVEKLALEFWPLTPDMLGRSAVTRLLRGLTFFWAGVNLVMAAATLTLLLWLPLATYVAVKQVTSLAITGAAIALTIHLSLRTARREGLAPVRMVRAGKLAR